MDVPICSLMSPFAPSGSAELRFYFLLEDIMHGSDHPYFMPSYCPVRSEWIRSCWDDGADDDSVLVLIAALFTLTFQVPARET